MGGIREAGKRLLGRAARRRPHAYERRRDRTSRRSSCTSAMRLLPPEVFAKVPEDVPDEAVEADHEEVHAAASVDLAQGTPDQERRSRLVSATFGPAAGWRSPADRRRWRSGESSGATNSPSGGRYRPTATSSGPRFLVRPCETLWRTQPSHRLAAARGQRQLGCRVGCGYRADSSWHRVYAHVMT